MKKLHPFAALTLVLPMLLASCAAAPSACPEPVLVKRSHPAREPLGPSFQDRMQLFLSGKLPEQSDSEQR